MPSTKKNETKIFSLNKIPGLTRLLGRSKGRTRNNRKTNYEMVDKDYSWFQRFFGRSTKKSKKQIQFSKNLRPTNLRPTNLRPTNLRRNTFSSKSLKSLNSNKGENNLRPNTFSSKYPKNLNSMSYPLWLGQNNMKNPNSNSIPTNKQKKQKTKRNNNQKGAPPHRMSKRTINSLKAFYNRRNKIKK